MLKVQYNKRNKMFVVFEAPEKGGLWRIKKSFKVRSEAEQWVKDQKS